MIEFVHCVQCKRPFFVERPLVAADSAGKILPCHRCRGAAFTWLISESGERLRLMAYEGHTPRIDFDVTDLITDLDNTRKVLEDLLEERGIPKKMYVVHYGNGAAAETIGVCLDLESAQRFVVTRSGITNVEWKEHDSHGRWWEPAGYNYQITEEDLVL